MSNIELIAIDVKEKRISDLKITLENKFNKKTKMIKCFGNDAYKKDYARFLNKMRKDYLNEIDILLKDHD